MLQLCYCCNKFFFFLWFHSLCGCPIKSVYRLSFFLFLLSIRFSVYRDQDVIKTDATHKTICCNAISGITILKWCCSLDWAWNKMLFIKILTSFCKCTNEQLVSYVCMCETDQILTAAAACLPSATTIHCFLLMYSKRKTIEDERWQSWANEGRNLEAINLWWNFLVW